MTKLRFFWIFLVEWSKTLWVWIENFNFSKWILACDLYSLTCGVLFGELILNSTCYSTKSYASLGDVYVYVTANSRLGSLFRMFEAENPKKSFTINVNITMNPKKWVISRKHCWKKLCIQCNISNKRFRWKLCHKLWFAYMVNIKLIISNNEIMYNNI